MLSNLQLSTPSTLLRPSLGALGPGRHTKTAETPFESHDAAQARKSPLCYTAARASDTLRQKWIGHHQLRLWLNDIPTRKSLAAKARNHTNEQLRRPRLRRTLVRLDAVESITRSCNEKLAKRYTDLVEERHSRRTSQRSLSVRTKPYMRGKAAAAAHWTWKCPSKVK